jgi:ATP-dependent Clp protease adaptor protein ClpS
MSKTITKDKVSEKIEELISQPYVLILHNDDYNSFDHVINCLMKYCDHEYEQAVQSSHIVHFVGKCDVKRGPKEKVEEAYDKLKSNGLSVTMETT